MNSRIIVNSLSLTPSSAMCGFNTHIHFTTPAPTSSCFWSWWYAVCVLYPLVLSNCRRTSWASYRQVFQASWGPSYWIYLDLVQDLIQLLDHLKNVLGKVFQLVNEEPLVVHLLLVWVHNFTQAQDGIWINNYSAFVHLKIWSWDISDLVYEGCVIEIGFTIWISSGSSVISLWVRQKQVLDLFEILVFVYHHILRKMRCKANGCFHRWWHERSPHQNIGLHRVDHKFS